MAVLSDPSSIQKFYTELPDINTEITPIMSDNVTTGKALPQQSKLRQDNAKPNSRKLNKVFSLIATNKHPPSLLADIPSKLRRKMETKFSLEDGAISQARTAD